MRQLLISLVLLSLSASALAADYQQGQVWTISEGGQKGKNVQIMMVEDHVNYGEVFHISVIGPFDAHKCVVLDELPHLPFSRQGLDSSNLSLNSDAEFINTTWREGYEYWYNETINGSAGVFDASVGEAVEFVVSNIPEDICEE